MPFVPEGALGSERVGYWLSDLELIVSYWLERGAQGISEYLILGLTRFRVHDFCEARSCSFVSPVLSPSLLMSGGKIVLT